VKGFVIVKAEDSAEPEPWNWKYVPATRVDVTFGRRTAGKDGRVTTPVPEVLFE
jgi:hypothetical protein